MKYVDLSLLMFYFLCLYEFSLVIFTGFFNNKFIVVTSFCYRIKDSSNFYQATKNMCDFIIFESPYLWLLELKSTKANQISTDEKIIKQHQIDSLYEAQTKHLFVECGFILNYRGRELKTKTVLPETYFIPINEMRKVYYKEKSIHKDLAREIGVEIPYRKKITRYEYDVNFEDFL